MPRLPENQGASKTSPQPSSLFSHKARRHGFESQLRDLPIEWRLHADMRWQNTPAALPEFFLRDRRREAY